MSYQIIYVATIHRGGDQEREVVLLCDDEVMPYLLGEVGEDSVVLLRLEAWERHEGGRLCRHE